MTASLSNIYEFGPRPKTSSNITDATKTNIVRFGLKYSFTRIKEWKEPGSMIHYINLSVHTFKWKEIHIPNSSWNACASA